MELLWGVVKIGPTEPRDARDMICEAACPLEGDTAIDAVLNTVGEASIVLLGEATHGTQEFYEWRARITQALIERRGFDAVAIEGDWPDAYRVNRFVQGRGDDADAEEALRGFQRFPTWMWRNTAVAKFVSWLRERNGGVEEAARTGFYGLDLYSLHASMRAVIAYLEQQSPAAAAQARASYACFEEFGHDTETYAWAASRVGENTCEEAVTRQLVELRRRRMEWATRDGATAAEAFFEAEQNARLAQNAEKYYRTMFKGRTASWNVRDEHMADTLEELMTHLRTRGREGKVVVWAHNSHLGDARATEMGQLGELNLGQLVRERHGPEVRSIGFTTYSGTVMAASDWGERPQRKRVRAALSDSYEELFHDVGMPAFFLPLAPGGEVHELLSRPRLERAIGVIYRPETERWSHYFRATLAAQFDGVIHIDETEAVEPLEGAGAWDEEEVPETFPSGV